MRQTLEKNKEDKVAEHQPEIQKQNDNEGLNLTKLVNPSEEMKQGRGERRWSERQQKNNMGDVEGLQRKANEGNTDNTNSFYILGNKEIMSRTVDMGVVFNDENTTVIDMLTELEKARQNQCPKSRNASVVDDQYLSDDNILCEKISDVDKCDSVNNCDLKANSSETDGFTLVTSKRVKNPK